jgi:hypothetical protein
MQPGSRESGIIGQGFPRSRNVREKNRANKPKDLSRFRNVRSKPDQEKVVALDKDVESKKCQGQRVPGNHGVRRPGAVPMGSPFSL